MSVQKEGESYSYWPGYVDALTNIVLNLLFLVAIFVIGVAALGLVAAQRKEIPLGAVVSTEPQSVVERVKNVVRKIIVSGASTSTLTSSVVQKSQASVTVAQIERKSDSFLIKLAFLQGSYAISPSEEPVLLRQMSAALADKGGKIVVWAAAPSDDGLLVRGSMTRLLSIRNMLLRHGVSSDLIEVRIVPQDARSQFSNYVFIGINKEVGDVENK